MPATTAYHAFLGRVRSLSRSNEGHHERFFDYFPRRSRLLSLESFMSFGMGSDSNGGTVTALMCANHTRRIASKSCPHPGIIVCTGCYLVKYCSERCQKNHWASHRSTCFHPYLDEAWRPGWVSERRQPRFLSKTVSVSPVWREIPAFSCLNLSANEGANAETVNLNLCFVASGDITGLVSTVNELPQDYSGQCNILLNDLDSVVANRNLIILFALLRSGPSLDEAAEFTTHLMYSAALPSASSSYWQQCLETVYGSACEGDMSFRVSLITRGEGMIHSMQMAMAIRQPLEMFQSNHNLQDALKNMRSVTMNLAAIDNEDYFFSKLKPVHRLAFKRFRETGILAPFALSTNNFSHPNRLLFSPSGHWLGPAEANPLRSWDLAAVQRTGAKYGVDSADIFGALFFHVKSQLREFARRVKDFDISIHVTQYDPRVLSKGISSGILRQFTQGCFDRVDVSNMPDFIGIQECLHQWAPLLNRRNPHASIFMHLRFWHRDEPNVLATNLKPNRKVLSALKQKCHRIPGFIHNLVTQGSHSATLIRLIESFDAFYDHDGAFYQYLSDQGAETTAASYGLSLRKVHRIHSKRFGISLDEPERSLSDITRNEFYDLFTIGGAELPVRFLEFETASDF